MGGEDFLDGVLDQLRQRHGAVMVGEDLLDLGNSERNNKAWGAWGDREVGLMKTVPFAPLCAASMVTRGISWT